MQELLKVIKETENDDLTNVMCKIVTTYAEQLTPIAEEMCAQLATTFQQVCGGARCTHPRTNGGIGAIH